MEKDDIIIKWYFPFGHAILRRSLELCKDQFRPSESELESENFKESAKEIKEKNSKHQR